MTGIKKTALRPRLPGAGVSLFDGMKPLLPDAGAEGRSDIEGRAEIVTLVDAFYTKVRKDDLLGPIFDEVAKVDWSEHLPKLYNFWQTILFGDGGYRGNPMMAHFKLVVETPMDWPRFERWLALFHETVDEHFAGRRATQIKKAAADMAAVIHGRINQIPDPRFDPANLTPEQRERYARYRDGSA